MFQRCVGCSVTTAQKASKVVDRLSTHNKTRAALVHLVLTRFAAACESNPTASNLIWQREAPSIKQQ
eukprot:m.41508 g.41508  ORF g.41508 m.41508 type:complete len:67 (-) comp12838_c0_seq1:1208-1408(-)